jgi:tetratricopeptide (TPR) repeat protein
MAHTFPNSLFKCTAVWNLREEIVISALLIGRINEAWPLVEQISRQFPDSARASRLVAMHFEATKDFSKAEELYKKELDKNPVNNTVLRRLITIKEAQGDLVGAIQMIRGYLDIHLTDWWAWEHAASLYLRTGAYSQAIFCLEEVLLHQPGNVNMQLLLAETFYSAGGNANYETARGYFSGVIEMTGGENARALYGVCACAAQLASGSGKSKGSSSSSGGDGGKNELGGLAGEALRQQYAVKNSDKLPLVNAMLKGQGLM